MLSHSFRNSFRLNNVCIHIHISTMSGSGKGVRRRTEKAIAGRERTGERGMRAAVNPASAVEPMARRRRRAAAETAPVRDPAPTPVPGPEPEAAPAAAPPAKRLRADESAGNADEPGRDSDEHVLPPRPEDKYQQMQVPEAVIEIAVQNTDQTRNVQVARDIVNVINSHDEGVASIAGNDNREKIRDTVQQTFSYYGEFYARQGCIQIRVKPKTIKHLFKLFEDCVSGEITKQLKPIEDIIRSIRNCENYRQNAVLYNDHYDSVMNDIASQMCRLLRARGLTLPNDDTLPKVNLSPDGNILVRVACPSMNERDEYANAITDGKFKFLFRTLEDNCRNAFEAPDIVLNATVLERTLEETVYVATQIEVATPDAVCVSTNLESFMGKCLGRGSQDHLLLRLVRDSVFDSAKLFAKYAVDLWIWNKF
ncbi:uncharacterized protein LOC127881526 isoform X3 [Dreissena polymorpha]|uniref:uncharacterized protein LOC127881526 isoform X3 n=1 Tax=Dreissena polymorpha TaxID=45954 RepID=UPI002264562D|nr:uncharacterized protein LOC127881526 isoform X3 [Dreissena polymorpha]